ncbi:MAG: hypothetical protein EHM40_20230, partial [Chloroflexi bacterium]
MITNRTYRSSILLALMLVFSLGGAGQPTAVQAAPPAQDITVTSHRYHFNIVMPPDPICVGKSYPIIVTPLRDGSGKFNGEKFNYDSRHLVGVTIEASVKNESIGTLSPRRKISGFAWAGENTDPNAENPGEADFTFRARKAGQTSLYFEATIDGRYVGPAVPIQVVNCRYKVTVSTRANASYPNLRSSIRSQTVGEMTSTNGQNFSGTASANWNASSFSVRCSHSHMFSPAQAHLSGTVDQDQLTVQVTFDAAS